MNKIIKTPVTKSFQSSLLKSPSGHFLNVSEQLLENVVFVCCFVLLYISLFIVHDTLLYISLFIVHDTLLYISLFIVHDTLLYISLFIVHDTLLYISLFIVHDTETKTETAANCLWLVTNSKSCPNCKSPIQKNEGCNHMKCSKVGCYG